MTDKVKLEFVMECVKELLRGLHSHPYDPVEAYGDCVIGLHNAQEGIYNRVDHEADEYDEEDAQEDYCDE